MLYNEMNRRGQVGETMTWVVATVIILVLAVIFLFATDKISKLQGISSISYEDSGLEEQQMLFAILDKTNGQEKTSDLIKEGKNEEAKKNIEESLVKFDSLGVRCNFELYSGEQRVFDVRYNVEPVGKKVKMMLNEKEVRLIC